jgi:amino acid adenylation domain-containing protein
VTPSSAPGLASRAPGSRAPGGAGATAAPIRRADRSRPLPLSYAQQQVWLHAQHAPAVPLYNEQVTVHYRGALDPGALARALGGVIARHEAWRTVFRGRGGHPLQVVLPATPIDLPVHDLGGLPREAREREAIRLATADARQPFDLAAGPLVRARLVRLDADDSRLYVTLHHIVFDGYSLSQVFVPELAALYAAAAGGGAAVSLPEPPLQYADWAVWQRAEVERGAYARQLEYWTRQLAGEPPTLEVGDRPRPAVQSYRGRRHAFVLPPALAARLKQLGRDERASLYMTLCAAFLVLLHRYTGEEDAVIGSVSAGRKAPEVARLLGFFANPIALRVELAGDPPFRTLLRRVRDVALDALTNDDVPFEHVVAALRPPRDPGRHPFFQVVFALEAPMAPLPGGWDLRHLDVETGAAKFDLYLEMHDRPDGLGGQFLYAADLFEPATVARMARHYENILAAVVDDPGLRLSGVPMLDQPELRQVLVEFAQAPAAYPEHATVHGLVAGQAARTPEAVALVAGDRRLTYGALQARAAGLAARLRALGVGPGDVVAVHAERSLEMVVGYLAVLQAGGAYLPLDPSLPTRRVAGMLQDAGARIALASRRAPSGALAGVAHTLWLDEASAGNAPDAAVGPDARAYVMFTSGSTGRPKGVTIPHRAVLRLVFGQDYVRFGAEEAFLQLATPTFDAATFEIWGALLHGGRCVILPPGVPTPRTLRETIGPHGVTTAFLTTSLFNAVIDEDAEALRGLRQIVIGGEALSPRHVARASAVLAGVRLVNGYGPTETTTFAACHHIPAPVDGSAGSIPIGRPIAGTEIYVLDRHRRPVPVGVPGEMYIGGAGLADGYINRDELTAERFVPHPFRAEAGARLYRTGDLARWRAEGTLEFLGRRDGQVKIRGVRIELGEVQAALAAHPAVREAAVVATDGPAGDRALLAYVVGDGRAPDASALRAFLNDLLPSAFVPAAFVPLDALPLTPSGKLDRRALPAPDALRVRRAATPARGPLRRELAALWSELLGVSEVGVDDDFFELGGHSLLAVRMLQRIQQLYGVALPLAALHTKPTIEGIATALLRHDAETGPGPAVRIRDGDGAAPVFFFHGDLNGGGFYCRKLARHLPPGRAVWAVPPLGVDGAVPLSIEAMARQHVQDLVALAPAGPVVLGGYCNGGLVAWETARLLTAAGRRVERVILVAADADTRFAGLRAPLTSAARLLGASRASAVIQFGRLRFFLSRLRALGGRQRAALALRGTARLAAQVARRVQRPSPRAAAPGTPRALGRYFDLVRSYVPGPWPGHVVVLWPADEPPTRPGDPTLGWGALAHRVDAYVVPGDHDEIVTRHIDCVAELLRPYL